MQGTFKKCVISEYDKTITHPPYKTVKIAEVEVFQPDNDDLCTLFYDNLSQACRKKGYTFKFYTRGKNGYDYEIVVY